VPISEASVIGPEKTPQFFPVELLGAVSMSALGHKPTYAVQKAMSVLHPIATAQADSRKR
jgi:hypothetical protein